MLLLPRRGVSLHKEQERLVLLETDMVRVYNKSLPPREVVTGPPSPAS